MTSRERIDAVLRGGVPDQVPCDFGGCSVTGMHVSVVYALRQALRLDPPGTPVKVIDPFQMLGEIDLDLVEALGIDALPLMGTGTFFGFPLADWKPWTTFGGTPVLVPGGFNTEPEADGRIFMYPQGDRSAPPSGVMPKGGHYFDAIVRQGPVDHAHLRVEDNVEEFGPIAQSELDHLAAESERLHATTDKAIFASFPGGGFGDLAWLPAPFLKHPRGIRQYDEWLMSLRLRPDFVHAVFSRQCEIALDNLERLFSAVGNRVSVLFLTGADYGMQTGPTVPAEMYRELYAPYYKRLTDWIHAHTEWKVFVHSCGAIEPLIEDFIAAGFDALNPVQTSAAGMDPALLKAKYGGRIVFWGGGVDTQHTLPNGTPGEVAEEVAERLHIFGEHGGYVFSAVHNIQPGVPTANLCALFDAYMRHRGHSDA